MCITWSNNYKGYSKTITNTINAKCRPFLESNGMKMSCNQNKNEEENNNLHAKCKQNKH